MSILRCTYSTKVRSNYNVQAKQKHNLTNMKK